MEFDHNGYVGYVAMDYKFDKVELDLKPEVEEAVRMHREVLYP